MYVGGFMTYWSNTTKDRTSAYRLDHANPSLQSPNKTNGHSLRCVDYFSTPSSTARWREITQALEEALLIETELLSVMAVQMFGQMIHLFMAVQLTLVKLESFKH